MKNILWSCKSSQLPWSVPYGGREAIRAFSLEEVNAAVREITARKNPKGWAFNFFFFFFFKSRD